MIMRDRLISVRRVLVTFLLLRGFKSRYYYLRYVAGKVLARIRYRLARFAAAWVPAKREAHAHVESTTASGILRAVYLEQKLMPLRVRVLESAPRRVNCLLPTIDPAIIFGGYVSYFNLMLRLHERGYNVRIIITEGCNYTKAELVEKTRNFGAVSRAIHAVEIAVASEFYGLIDVNPEDEFVAYSIWDALKAHHAAKQVGKTRFVFYIQEYEGVFHCHDSVHALTDYVYGLPHMAVFNSEMLRDYFKMACLGVYADGGGDKISITFRHALGKVQAPDVATLGRRTQKKLLFYARPEAHAGRNLFEVGYLALKRAVREGVFSSSWKFDGVGSTGYIGSLALGDGLALNMIGRMDPDEYWRKLPEYDLGLSLIYAPHPSVPNLEMASAGLVTVTTTFVNRPRSAMEAISRNLIAVEPHIEAVVGGLREAVGRIDDYQARLRHAQFDWPRDWKDSFDDDFFDAFEGLLKCNSRRIEVR